MYRDGKGVKLDHPAAMRFFQAAADKGYSRAQTAIGKQFLQGDGVAQDSATAMTWFLRAAEQGEVEAQMRLALMYTYGTGVKPDLAVAVAWYRKVVEPSDAAKQDIPAPLVKKMIGAALFAIGTIYDQGGTGVPIDVAAAKDWYRKASDQGNTQATARLAELEQPAGAKGNEISVSEAWSKAREAYDRKDYKAAKKWFQTAADGGSPAAHFSLGIMYRDGQGSKRDYAAAMNSFQAAADLGYPRAQTAIGTIYRDGEGVKRDYAKAMNWYLKAAEQGEVEAQGSISAMYLGGHGVKQDFETAMVWLRKAAEPGVASQLGAPAARVKEMNAAAQFTIGRLYEDGRGVPVDVVTAKAWYRRAADNGDPDAKTKLAELDVPSNAGAPMTTFLCDSPLLNGKTEQQLIFIDTNSKYVKIDTFTQGILEYRDGLFGKVIKSGFMRNQAADVHQFVTIGSNVVKFGTKDGVASENTINLQTGVFTMAGLVNRTALCSRR